MGYYAKRFFGQQHGIITDGLKLWLDASNPLSYPGSGTTWFDLSGNSNNGTMVNGVAYNSANGGVMSFDGVDDYVSLINPIQNPLEMSINLWFYPIYGMLGVIYSCRNSNTELIQITKQSATEVLYQIRGANNMILQLSHSIQLNQWVNLVGVFNKNTGVHTFCKNGECVNGSLNLSGIALNSTAHRIGSIYTNNGFVNMLFNEPAIYNRALTASEVLQNYNATKSKYGL